MLEEKVVKLDADSLTYLKRIANGVMVILWILVSVLVFWPLSNVIASYTDTGQPTTLTNSVAVAVAVLVGYLITRLVFPIEYTSAEMAKNPENK